MSRKVNAVRRKRHGRYSETDGKALAGIALGGCE